MNLNDKKVINEYVNFYGAIEEEELEDEEYSEGYLLNDNLNECDAESSNDENLMLNNDKLCAAYSENLNESINQNTNHSKAWRKLN